MGQGHHLSNFNFKFRQFCEETELNGLTHVPQASKCGKIFWLISFLLSAIAAVIIFSISLSKFYKHPKGINQDFVINEAMPFPELRICRYLVGLSNSQIEKFNVSQELKTLLHWRLEVNYNPNFFPPQMVKYYLNKTREEYNRLKTRLNVTYYHQILQGMLPNYSLTHHMTAVVYNKDPSGQSMYWRSTVQENMLITYVEDLYLYNAICHGFRLPNDSVLSLLIPFPPKEEFYTDATQNFQLLPIARSYLLMDGNHDVIARVEPGRKYWAGYKVRSTNLLNTADQPCIDNGDYHQQHCIQECFGQAVKASTNCTHCQSVFMHIQFGRNGISGGPDICDPWQWFECNSTSNPAVQNQLVSECVKNCLLACTDTSFEYTVTSVGEDKGLSKHVGWQSDMMELSENRSIFILAPSKNPNKHIRIEQYEVMDVASVLGDFGGYMGLFLGSSILTLVHIIVFLFRLAKNNRLVMRFFEAATTNKKHSTASNLSSAAVSTMVRRGHGRGGDDEHLMSMTNRNPNPNGGAGGPTLLSTIKRHQPPPLMTSNSTTTPTRGGPPPRRTNSEDSCVQNSRRKPQQHGGDELLGSLQRQFTHTTGVRDGAGIPIPSEEGHVHDDQQFPTSNNPQEVQTHHTRVSNKRAAAAAAGGGGGGGCSSGGNRNSLNKVTV